MIGNALPVLAIKDGSGWHLDPYTNNGESFYSLAADFKVTLDHPTTRRSRPRAPRWTPPAPADARSPRPPPPRSVTSRGRRALFQQDLGYVGGGHPDQHLLGLGISSSSAQSMLTTAKTAVDAHAGRFGAYPYGELDAVIDNNFWFVHGVPGFVLDLVSTTALTHEIGHQWFYGIVGDDEYNSPWLDEAFTDYATDLALGILGRTAGTASPGPRRRRRSPTRWPTGTPTLSRYSTVVYSATASAPCTTPRVLGDTAMAKLLKDYATSHWYGVSTTAEFRRPPRPPRPRT